MLENFDFVFRSAMLTACHRVTGPPQLYQVFLISLLLGPGWEILLGASVDVPQ